MTTLHIHIGGSLAATKARLRDAAERHQAGGDVDEHHLTFESWAGFAKVMTTNRLELLHHVHANPPRSILALAKAIGRDYRRVHEDVEALTAAGLLERGAAGPRAEYDAIRIAL